MKYDGFSYEFSISELTYLIFRKKKCPYCGEKMIKIKTFQIVKGSDIGPKSDSVIRHCKRVKKYSYIYKCESCQHEYSLFELAGSELPTT